MKHTPGPWKAECPICEGDTMQVRDKDGRRIAIIKGVYPMGPKTEDANARLIAAAPEMLEALKGIKDLSESVSCVCAEGPEFMTKTQMCEYVIGKTLEIHHMIITTLAKIEGEK